MATGRDEPADPGGLQQHPLVDALRPDPNQPPPDVTVLQGFLGKSPTDGAWRLYLTSALDEYVEIAESNILHSQTLPDGAGTIVWVPKSLSLSHIKTHSQQVQADFLSGAIAARALPTTASTPGTIQPTVMRPTATVIPSLHAICPTPTAVHSIHVACPTPPVPSLHVICPTPSALHACGHPSLPLCLTETIPPTNLARCPQSVVFPCHRVTLPFSPSEACMPSVLGVCPSDFGTCAAVTQHFCPTIGQACVVASAAGCPPVSQGCPGGLGRDAPPKGPEVPSS